MASTIRRVVTGTDTSGRAVVIRDDKVAPTTTALTAVTYHELWRADHPPRLPSAGVNGDKTTFFPPAGGYRFFVITIPPGDGHGQAENLDLDTALREMQDKLPGMLDVSEFDNPGMHTTDTVDMEIVLSGEVVLELDDGIEVTLRAGETIIQNGTRHRWHNRGVVPAVMVVAMVGGSRHYSSASRWSDRAGQKDVPSDLNRHIAAKRADPDA